MRSVYQVAVGAKRSADRDGHDQYLVWNFGDTELPGAWRARCERHGAPFVFVRLDERHPMVSFESRSMRHEPSPAAYGAIWALFESMALIGQGETMVCDSDRLIYCLVESEAVAHQLARAVLEVVRRDHAERRVTDAGPSPSPADRA